MSTQTTSVPKIERVLDLDAHEMVPVELRDEIFGHTVLNDALAVASQRFHKDHPNRTQGRVTGDDEPINYETVWNLKGGSAPSAIDLSRRLEVMDLMGVERQLCYPTFGVAGVIAASDPQAAKFFGLEDYEIDWQKAGLEAIQAHNKWAAQITKATNARVRPVGIVLTDAVDHMVGQVEELLADGVRSIVIPVNAPPAGTSPAAPALDPFWRLCADANVSVTAHLGTERGFLASALWGDHVDVFQPSFKSTMEFIIEPLSCVTLHYAPENYLAAMVLGGVFERHPTLRFGLLEFGASWFGPLAERMDLWAETMFPSRFGDTLSMRPSEYMARNVRVTPFFFEPVDMYLERYPQLASAYCYSTDYPHFEGGRDSKRLFAERLSGVSAKLRDMFFYKNPALLLPE